MIYNNINHETIRLRKNYGIYNIFLLFFEKKQLKL